MRSGMMGTGWMEMRGAVCIALVMVGVAGCGADEVPPVPLPGEEIFVTMQGALPLDFVMERLPNGGITPSAEVAEASIVHGYMVDSYLVDGAMIEIVWVHDPATGYPKSGDLRTQVTPVIFRNDQMDGWGWEQLDLRAAEWNIVDRSQRAAPPVDSSSPADGTDAEGTDIQSSDTQASAAGVEPSEDGAEDAESFSF